MCKLISEILTSRIRGWSATHSAMTFMLLLVIVAIQVLYLLRSQNVCTRLPQMLGAPGQPGSPDGVGPDKFIEVDLSKASEWS